MNWNVCSLDLLWLASSNIQVIHRYISIWNEKTLEALKWLLSLLPRKRICMGTEMKIVLNIDITYEMISKYHSLSIWNMISHHCTYMSLAKRITYSTKSFCWYCYHKIYCHCNDDTFKGMPKVWIWNLKPIRFQRCFSRKVRKQWFLNERVDDEKTVRNCQSRI